jgi:hypothetical protein
MKPFRSILQTFEFAVSRVSRPDCSTTSHAPFSDFAASFGFRISVFWLLLGDLLFFAQPLPALNLLVYNNDDSGPGSLRQAINDNNASGANTIVFSNVVTGTITLTSGELLITRFVTILGPGAGNLSVDGNAASRVFRFSSSSNAVAAVVSGLTITNGAVSGSFPGNVGGGIWNDRSTLTLSNCIVTGNSGGNGPAGAIFNDHGNLTLSHCTLSSNSAAGYGGAIWNYGDNGSAFVSLNSTTVSDNTTTNTAGSFGGAILNDGSFGLAGLSASSSTFSGNSASQYGGAIYNNGSGSGNAQLNITGSTFSGNSAGSGGGIFHNGIGGSALLIIGNTLLKTGALGENIVNNGGVVSSFGYNLSSDNGGDVLTNATDQLNKEPLLGPLADNGGPTSTHALLPGSPAIDKGKNFGLTTDQRGEPRPFHFSSITNAPGGDGSDIGAFEVGRPLLSITRLTSGVVLSWPAYSGDFTLESVTTLNVSNDWSTVTNPPTVHGTNNVVTNSTSDPKKYYRLRMP